MLKGDIDLLNHVIGKTDVTGCCFAGFVLR